MGACIMEPKTKAKQKEVEAYKKANNVRKPQPIEKEPAPIKQSPFKSITEEQIMMQYSVDELTKTATTLEGPKIIVHRATGALKVLRVIVKGGTVVEDRIVKFKNITNCQAYELGQYYILMLEFFSGKTILQHMAANPNVECSQLFQQIYRIIESIHAQGMYHGNLTFDSFRLKAGPSLQVGLAEMNFNEKGQELFGSLHKNSQSADWQFFGILLFVATYGSIPFYSKQSLRYASPTSITIGDFLQGKKVPLSNQSILAHNNIGKVLMAYQLRNNIFRMLKLRQKRRRYETKYFYDKQTNGEINFARPLEEQRVKIQKNRIMNSLKEILAGITSECQQDYVSMTLGGPKLNDFISLVRINSPEKRLEELIYKLSSILG